MASRPPWLPVEVNQQLFRGFNLTLCQLGQGILSHVGLGRTEARAEGSSG
jgi:hypothetical protein